MSGVIVMATVDGPSVEVDSTASDCDTFEALLDALTVTGMRLGFNTSVILFTGGGMRIEMKPMKPSQMPAPSQEEKP